MRLAVNGRQILSTSMVVMALAIPCAAGAEDRTHEVKFKPGAISTTLKGSVKGYDTVSYIIGANGGQAASILLDPSNASCYFNLLPPGSKEAIFIGSSSGNEFASQLPQDGNYRAQVYLMRNAARRGETCNFSITFEING